MIVYHCQALPLQWGSISTVWVTRFHGYVVINNFQIICIIDISEIPSTVQMIAIHALCPMHITLLKSARLSAYWCLVSRRPRNVIGHPVPGVLTGNLNEWHLRLQLTYINFSLHSCVVIEFCQKRFAINLLASFVSLATYGRNQPYHHCTWFEALWQTGCHYCCHHCTALAGRWNRLAAGSKNVPPDLEFELRDRKLPDLHLKTGTRGREYNDLHFLSLVKMQKRSLTKLSLETMAPCSAEF